MEQRQADLQFAKDWLREQGYHKSYYETDKYAEIMVDFGNFLFDYAKLIGKTWNRA